MLLGALCSLSCSRGSAPANEMAGSPMAGAFTGGSAASSSAGADSAPAGDAGRAAPLVNDTASGAFVHLFEWRWPDVARECESFLGPKGFTAVQISPPSEHAVLSASFFPWWQRYQTVSYALDSRSGTRAELIDMVARCRAAGVGIYVDAVLNHTTAQTSGTGSAGTSFSKYRYPELFEPADFHQPACQIESSDYAFDATRVQRCELLGLADLDTGKQSVQVRLAGYLSALLELGVRGFRLDAAKHVAPTDLAAILAKVVPRADEQPYYFLEVIDHGGEAVRASDYLQLGGGAEQDVTEFKYSVVGDAFLGRSSANLAGLTGLGASDGGLLPSERAVVFIDNHDTQRADAIFYQDGRAHDLANVFMLAWPYGYPSIMSSYGFDRSIAAGRDAGPPSAGSGTTLPVYEGEGAEPSCVAEPHADARKGWVCEHRKRHVASMVLFRKVTVGAPVENVWTNGQNQLAFSRGSQGFVAINHESSRLTQALPTGLPKGSYCDVLSGDFEPAANGEPARCGGAVVNVDGSTVASLDLPAETALALHARAKL
jgi:alpha-amylase